MKKESHKKCNDYSKYKYNEIEYYGVLPKKGRIRIDTKRYSKYFELPNKKICHRTTVYYVPNKIHREEYIANIFVDEIKKYKDMWEREFKNTIKSIKSPKEVEDDTRVNYLTEGIFDPDEASIIATVAKCKRANAYQNIIKCIYAEYVHLFMSAMEALLLKVCSLKGYKESYFNKRSFSTFLQGVQGINSIKLEDYKYFEAYNKTRLVWNCLKHNSVQSLDELKNLYPDMISNKSATYNNGDPSILFLNVSEEYLFYCFDNLKLFYLEICEKVFEENINDASWDYDDYFVKNVKEEIEAIDNPLGLPSYL